MNEKVKKFGKKVRLVSGPFLFLGCAIGIVGFISEMFGIYWGNLIWIIGLTMMYFGISFLLMGRVLTAELSKFARAMRILFSALFLCMAIGQAFYLIDSFFGDFSTYPLLTRSFLLIVLLGAVWGSILTVHWIKKKTNRRYRMETM